MEESIKRKRTLRGILCAALGGTCWGFSGTCAQMLMNNYGIPVTWLIPVRMLGAAVLFLAIVLVRQRSAFFACLRDVRSLLAIAGFALLGVFMTQVTYLSCIHYTNSGTGTVLERTGLVFIMLVVCMRARRLPKKREFLGLLFALAGTAIIAFQGDFTHLSIPPKGLIFGILSGVSLMFYTMMPVKPLEKWGSMIVTGLAMFTAGIMGTITMQPWNISVSLEGSVLIGIIALILVGTFGAYIFYLQGITDAGPVKASLVGCVEPISATIFAAVWLGTSFTMWDILGCALIITMMFLVIQKEEEPVSATQRMAATRSSIHPYDLVETDASEINTWQAESRAHEELTPIFQGSATKLGRLSVRHAQMQDLDAMQKILSDSRKFLASMRVKTGVKPYPSARRLERSIRNEDCYVVLDENKEVCALFNVTLDGDCWYDTIYDGAWLTESDSTNPSYAVLRWLTVRSDALHGGVGMYALAEAERIAQEAGMISMRADTYEGNIPMQRILLKKGYRLCGTIKAQTYFEGPNLRSAFEKLL